MNWVKFYWNKDTDLFKCYPNIPMVADCSAIDKFANNPLFESLKLISEITKNYPPPYYLMVSGGIDSQAMLYAWIMSGEKFIPVSFTYNKTFNSHDLYHLKLFSEKYNLEVNYIDIDYFNFLYTELIDYCKKFICNSPQINLHIKFNSYFPNGTVIHSGSPMFTNIPVNNTMLALYRYKLIENQNVIPFFFLDSPKIAGAFKNFVQNTLEEVRSDFGYKPDDYTCKALMYKNAGFDIIPSTKFTGFEQYKRYYDQYPNLVSTVDRFKYANMPSKRVFDLKFRYPLFEINNYTENTYTTF